MIPTIYLFIFLHVHVLCGQRAFRTAKTMQNHPMVQTGRVDPYNCSFYFLLYFDRFSLALMCKKAPWTWQTDVYNMHDFLLIAEAIKHFLLAVIVFSLKIECAHELHFSCVKFHSQVPSLPPLCYVLVMKNYYCETLWFCIHGQIVLNAMDFTYAYLQRLLCDIFIYNRYFGNIK